jgi:uncharacterized Zn finger protein
MLRRFLLPVRDSYMPWCPACGCGLPFHDSVYRTGTEVIPVCQNCGKCWRAVGTPFAQAVADRLKDARTQGLA